MPASETVISQSQPSPQQAGDSSYLDLHWKDEDPDVGIAPEGVCCKDMDDIINRIDKVKDSVKKIDLNNQHALTEVPSILSECKLLEEINISHTEITEIPDFLFTMPGLRYLSCCCRKLFNPPVGISKAEKLERLHFRVNENWNFPEGITALQELKALTIDFYSAVSLPNDLGTLKKLEDLALYIKYEEGAIPSLPDSFTGHSSLKKISISDNIRKIHKTFDLDGAAQILVSCPSFECFQLSGLAAEKGYQNLSRLENLKELGLRHMLVQGNPFDAVPALKKLEKLDIWGSELRLTELPDIFTNLPELRVFSFAGNLIKALPPSIYSLANLKTLEIGSTGISALDEKIGNLQSLEKLHVYDNMLETLPEAIFTLPRLALLNIEDNCFKPNEIAAIKQKIASLAEKDQKIEFMSDGQGHRQMVKKLRTLSGVNTMDVAVYYKYCLSAVNENPYSLKYVDKNKLQSNNYYMQLCIAAVRKDCSALEIIDPEKMDKSHYFYICIEAARSPEIGRAFKLIRDDLLADHEYIQVCLEAALHNNHADFLNNINGKLSTRLSRSDYERICWAAVLHYPPAIIKMVEPTEELYHLVINRGYGKKQ